MQTEKGYYEFMPGDEIEYEHSFRWAEDEYGMQCFDSPTTVSAVAMGFDTRGKATAVDLEDEPEPEEGHWLLRAIGKLLTMFR